MTRHTARLGRALLIHFPLIVFLKFEIEKAITRNLFDANTRNLT